jgi:preprotein translocase subunit SecA
MIGTQEIVNSHRSELFLINSALNNLEMVGKCQLFQQDQEWFVRTGEVMNELRARALELRDKLEGSEYAD